jgi:prolyl-tRNA synthetase
MRQSTLFTQTLRSAPADVEALSQQHLLRAGYIRPVGQGELAFLPLAEKTLARLEALALAVFEAAGAQPVAVASLVDSSEPAEHGLAELMGRELRSHRQLPALLLQNRRHRGSLRVLSGGQSGIAPLQTLDLYALHLGQAGSAPSASLLDAVERFAGECGLPLVRLFSGADGVQALAYRTPLGEAQLLTSENGYIARREMAQFVKPSAALETPLPLEAVATPGATTIQALADFLGVPPARTAKSLFVMARVDETDRLVVALVRGDMDVSEWKLRHALGAAALRPATAEELASAGIVPGYGSPIGARALRVVDDAVVHSPNLVAGANEAGMHFLNSNCGRDYSPDLVADIAQARPGDAAPDGGTLQAARGVVLGSVGPVAAASALAGLSVPDRDGSSTALTVFAGHLYLDRWLACIAEHYHDSDGLMWPVAAAPFDVHLLLLGGEDEPRAAAEDLYGRLVAAGLRVLYDDRDERPGVKFKDADLIGVPVRLSVGARSLAQGGVELKRRDAPAPSLVPLSEVIQVVTQALEL